MRALVIIGLLVLLLSGCQAKEDPRRQALRWCEDLHMNCVVTCPRNSSMCSARDFSTGNVYSLRCLDNGCYLWRSR